MNPRGTLLVRAYGAGLALAFALGTGGVAGAQSEGTPSDKGIVVGEVDRCVNGAESPAVNVAVGVQEGSPSMTRTDNSGQFILALVPGQYTVIATGDDGSGAMRPYVPVSLGQEIDIGNLDLGAGFGGCGDDSGGPVAPPAQSAAPATATPVPPTPTAVLPTPTVVPPTPTPAPAETDTTAPEQPDTTAPAGSDAGPPAQPDQTPPGD
jgi:hypothetical protein